MSNKGLQILKRQLEEKVAVLDKRIERRNMPCFFDESDVIGRLHNEAYIYEQVIKMIEEIHNE